MDVQDEVYLGTYEPEHLSRDVKDALMRHVTIAKKGSLAIVLGDDYGDNERTLAPISGQYQLGQKYRLIAVPEREGTDN